MLSLISKITGGEVGRVKLAIFSALFTLGPLAATAQINTCNNLIATITRLARFGGGLISTIAIVVFIISAYYFLFAAGSEEGATKGRQYLTYGVVGIIVGLIAFSLPTLVQTITGIQPGGGCP